MLNLENVTLVILSSIKLDKSIKALEYSCGGINFGSVKLVSHEKPDNLPDFITHEFCPKMSNVDEWNYAAIYELPKHIETEFCILVHDDGFIVNPDSYVKNFRNIDGHFRKCLQNNRIYKCISSNPYKSVVPYRKYVAKRKKVDYTRYKKLSHLMPISFD